MNTLTIIFLYIAVLFMGCSSQQSASQAPVVVDDERLLVETLSEKMTLEPLQSFSQQVDRLADQAKLFCQSEQQDVSLAELQDTWTQAMVQYHRVTPLLMGRFSLLESNTPLRFIYSPQPDRRAEQFIGKQISRAEQLQEKYTMPRPLRHSLGLDAMENLFFNIMSAESAYSSESGSCVYLNYITQDLVRRVSDLTEQWIREELEFIKSPQGQTNLREVISRYSSHLIRYFDEQVIDLGIRAPLGISGGELSCDQVSCADEFLEHPFYHNPEISLLIPLRLMRDLFTESSEKSFGDNLFNFSDYLVNRNQLDDKSGIVRVEQAVSQLTVMIKGRDFRSLFSKSTNEQESISSVLKELETFSQWMKVDFLVNMNAELPKPVQGDGD